MKLILKYIGVGLLAAIIAGALASCVNDGQTAVPEPDSDSSYADGYEAGLAAGNQAGYESGHKDGYDAGHKDGYDEGHKDGYDAGHKDGYDTGIAEGGNVGGEEDGGKNVTTVSLKAVETSVMTFNIKYNGGSGEKSWASRKAALMDFVYNSGVEIIGFQEICENQANDIKAAMGDKYELIWFASYPDENPQGNAVAYKKDTWKLAEEAKNFWLSPTPDVQSHGWYNTNHYRTCINALLEHIETGERFNVFVTHLDHAQSGDRVNGIKLIFDRMGESEYPVYLCGDFNCTTTSDGTYAYTTQKLQDGQVTALDSEEGSTFTGWGTYTDEDKYVIDFCFFSKDNVVVKTYDICDGKWGENNEYYLSDHQPVVCTVRLIYDMEISYPEITDGGFDSAIDTAQNS